MNGVYHAGKHPVLIAVFLIPVFSLQAFGQDDDSTIPVPRETVIGTVFMVRPAWNDSIDSTVTSVREEIRTQAESGKLICYISTPLSSRGGGHRPTNVDISKYVKRRVESRFGRNKFWALAPGVVENELPTVDGESARGGEYLYMWTEILAGEDGNGLDFDMVYFVGPTDMHAYFGIENGGIFDSLSDYIDTRSEVDEEFKQQVAENTTNRKGFIKYYGLRASASFSKGAMDEWNIFRLINRRRQISDQVAFYFDGRQVAPSAAEASVRPGYEQREKLREPMFLVAPLMDKQFEGR